MTPEPPSSREKQSFWSTLPGILSQLAALIAAITALLALLLPHCHKGIDGSPTPTPSPTALTPTPTATPTATPPSPPLPPPKRKEVLLESIDLEVIAKGPNKQIDDDIIFTVTKGTETLAGGTISAKAQPWRISQRISLPFNPPIHVHAIDSLRLTVSKKPHFGQDLVLTMAVSGRMSDGRTPMLLDSTQFDLGRGHISGHESSHEFKLKRPVQ